MLRAVILLGLVHFTTAVANATPLTLEYLVSHDAEIHSTDGALEFEDFSAVLSGMPGADLSRFLVVPLVNGLRLEVASGEFLPTGAQLVLHYEVETEDESEDEGHAHGSAHPDPIRSMSMTLVGSSVLAPLSAGMVALPDDDDHHHGAALAEVFASTATPPGPFSAADFSEPSHEFYARATFSGGGGGSSRDSSPAPIGAEMRFSTQPIPEPSSALLMGLGLLVLASRTRRGQALARSFV